MKRALSGKNLVDAAFACGVQHCLWPALSNTLKEANINVPHFTDKAIVADYIVAKGFKFVSFPMPGQWEVNEFFFFFFVLAFEQVVFVPVAFYFQNFLSTMAPKWDGDTLVFSVPETETLTMFDVEDTGD